MAFRHNAIKISFLIATMAIDQPFEYLSIGGTFSRAFCIIRERFGFFVSIGAIVLVLLAALKVSYLLLLTIWTLEDERIPDFEPKHVPLVVLVFGLEILSYEMASFIGRAAIMRAVAKMYLGESATLKECMEDVWMKKVPLLSTFAIIGAVMGLWVFLKSSLAILALMSGSLVVVVILFLLGLVAFCGMLYLYTGISLAYPSIVVENFRGPLQGIKRSWELTAGSRCYIATVLGCPWLLNKLISTLLRVIFWNKDPQFDALDLILDIPGVLMSLLPILIYLPMHATLETVIYLNLRIGRESMNLQVLTGDLASNTPTNAVPFRNEYSAPTETMTDDLEGEPAFEGLVINEIA